jgi:hypothetical protein
MTCTATSTTSTQGDSLTHSQVGKSTCLTTHYTKNVTAHHTYFVTTHVTLPERTLQKSPCQHDIVIIYQQLMWIQHYVPHVGTTTPAIAAGEHALQRITLSCFHTSHLSVATHITHIPHVGTTHPASCSTAGEQQVETLLQCSASPLGACCPMLRCAVVLCHAVLCC